MLTHARSVGASFAATRALLRPESHLFWPTLNVVFAGLLLALAADILLVQAIAAFAALILAFTGVRAAWHRMRALGINRTLLDVAELWVPGFVALCLATCGLLLSTSKANGEALRLAGAALFLLQTLLILRVYGQRTSRARSSRT